jgi:exocyst complex component 7
VGSEFQVSVFPREELATLQPLVKFLRGLPLPATHPSHPASAVILSALKEAQRGYAEMRGNWARKCLEVYGRRVVDRAETTDGVTAGQELGKWTNDLLDVIEVSLPYEHIVRPDLATGRIQSTHSACSAPWPSASSFYLHCTSHTSNYPLQHHTVLSLHPNQAFIAQVHLPRACFLLGVVAVPRQMGRPHHATRRAEGKRT